MKIELRTAGIEGRPHDRINESTTICLPYVASSSACIFAPHRIVIIDVASLFCVLVDQVRSNAETSDAHTINARGGAMPLRCSYGYVYATSARWQHQTTPAASRREATAHGLPLACASPPQLVASARKSYRTDSNADGLG